MPVYFHECVQYQKYSGYLPHISRRRKKSVRFALPILTLHNYNLSLTSSWCKRRHEVNKKSPCVYERN